VNATNRDGSKRSHASRDVGEASDADSRVSAFSGSDLEIVLRANDTQLLILAGIATSGVVLSTVREASDRDYRLVVLSDCCADSDPEVHDVLVRKVFPRQGEVMTGREWLSEAG
jgi:nicotinamidase-related amidase